jgi:hypothetical protein
MRSSCPGDFRAGWTLAIRQPILSACVPAASAPVLPPPPARSSRAGSACALGVSPLEAPATLTGKWRAGRRPQGAARRLLP